MQTIDNVNYANEKKFFEISKEKDVVSCVESNGIAGAIFYEDGDESRLLYADCEIKTNDGKLHMLRVGGFDSISELQKAWEDAIFDFSIENPQYNIELFGDKNVGR